MFDKVRMFAGVQIVLFKLLPAIQGFYEDLVGSDGSLELNKPENLTKIADFALKYSGELQDYVAPNEVTLLVCGILGVLHKGDSSSLYIDLLSHQENHG